MNAHEAVEQAVAAADKSVKYLRKKTTNQIQTSEEKDAVRGTALAWFNGFRASIAVAVGEDTVAKVDANFRSVLAAVPGSPSRSRLINQLCSARKALRHLLKTDIEALLATDLEPSSDEPIDLSPLIVDTELRDILTRRWRETVACLEGNAPLAAIVMIGGLLEGLLVARVHGLSDKKPVFTAVHAPKDAAGNVLQKLDDWTLRNYIDVAHELGWLSPGTHKLSEVVRDFRNYIHPNKEQRHHIKISTHDARTFWEIAKSIAVQIVAK